MGTRWRTSWKRPDGAAPTVCVGESGVASVGIVRLESGAAPRRGGRTRRRGSRARRARGTARCGGRSARAARRPAAAAVGRDVAGARPRSGGDARADHGVGVERVVERHRLARRHRALRVVEADLAGRPSSCSTVHGTGRPCALTCATARAPGDRAAGRPRSATARPAATDERSTSAALADGDPARRHVDVRHVAPLTVAPVAHAAPLAHRDELDRVDRAGRPALAVDHLGRRAAPSARPGTPGGPRRSR